MLYGIFRAEERVSSEPIPILSFRHKFMGFAVQIYAMCMTISFIFLFVEVFFFFVDLTTRLSHRVFLKNGLQTMPQLSKEIFVSSEAIS